MAKRRTEIAVTHDPEDPPYSYTLWVDDPKIASKIKDIGGVIDMCDNCANKGPGWVWIDPRYDAREVIAEIKALADGKEPQGDTLESLKAEAQDLGNRVDRAGLWSTIGMEYVRAAVAGRSYQNRAWLHSMHREIGEILSGEPQPEPKDLSEQAAALGRQALRLGRPVTGIALAYLKAVDQERGTVKPMWLWQIALHIFRRLRNGNWC